MKNKFLYKTAFLICLIGLGSCKEIIRKPSELIEKNLEATSDKNNWENFKSTRSVIDYTSSVQNEQMNFSNSSTLNSTAMIPSFLRTESVVNDTINSITLRNEKENYLVQFKKGKFFGINTIPKQSVSINPVLDLRPRANSFKVIDTIWKSEPVYILRHKDSIEYYVFDKTNYQLKTKISQTNYGTSNTEYSQYSNVDGYILPFKIESVVENAGYKTTLQYTSIIANPNVTEDFFKLDKSWTAINIGSKIPEFELPKVNDNSKVISSSSISGKLILIDFWATWCMPCIKEFPNMKKAYKDYKDRGFEIVSISVDEDKEKLDQYLKNNPFPWKHNLYIEDGFNSKTAKDFQIVKLPKPILIDQEGKIIAMDADLRDGGLETILQEVFKDEN